MAARPCRNEIVDWLIAESGSTRLKAEMQWRAVRNGTLAAAGMPAMIALSKVSLNARGLKVGNPNEPDTVIGPLLNAKQMKAALNRLEAARAAGARRF